MSLPLSWLYFCALLSNGSLLLPRSIVTPHMFRFSKAHPAALGFQRGIPLLKTAVEAARICAEGGGPMLSVQLDHGTAEGHVEAAVEAGVDSVM